MDNWGSIYKSVYNDYAYKNMYTKGYDSAHNFFCIIRGLNARNQLVYLVMR